MESESSNKGQLRAWVDATRPKTLAAAVVPIFVGSAEAFRVGVFETYPVVICLAFSLLVQIATNMANDYFDFIKGADTDERLGPERMVATGAIAPKAMLWVAIALFAVAFFVGLNLVFYRGWEMLAIGVVSILFGYCYTGGPYPLAYKGLGDIFVVLFFGLVATGGTFYVIVGVVSGKVLLLGGALGLLANNILIANNSRDRTTDEKAGKRTLIVACGRLFGIYQFAAQLLATYGLLVVYVVLTRNGWAMLPLLTLPLAWKAQLYLARNDGQALNRLLGMSARLLVVFGGLATVGILLGS